MPIQPKRRAILVVVASVVALVAAARAAMGDSQTWNPKQAAAYLDGRAEWWSTWPNAARDHETFCVSCHTAAPYAIGRPALRAMLKESGPSAQERRLHENVARRVKLWNEVAPFYADQTRGIPKTSESRGTEAVLNALVLSTRDAETGTLSADTRAAFANMWGLQMLTGDLKGGWAWLNFHYEPWEAPASPYFGASLAAIAIGTAPGGYAASAEAKDGVARLRDYLGKGVARQSLFNQLMIMWASARLDGVIAAGPTRDHRQGGAVSPASGRRLEPADSRRVEARGRHGHRHARGWVCHRADGAGASAEWSRRGGRRNRSSTGLAAQQSGSRDWPLDRRVPEQESRSELRSWPIHERRRDRLRRPRPHSRQLARARRLRSSRSAISSQLSALFKR